MHQRGTDVPVGAKSSASRFFETPSLGEALKGFGAVAAIVFLALPRARQMQLVTRIWRAVVHVVPALVKADGSLAP